VEIALDPSEKYVYSVVTPMSKSKIAAYQTVAENIAALAAKHGALDTSIASRWRRETG
jgi:hypothetical protein